jgi:predicted PurR-regulated permease PerM
LGNAVNWNVEADTQLRMNLPIRISYALVVLMTVLIVWLHLGTFLLTTLFGYLALQMLSFSRSKALSVALYLVVVAVIAAGLVYFSGVAYRTFPKIAETSIPAMVGFAEKNGIALPFSDFESLKSEALQEARDGVATIGRYASVASIQFVLLVAGLVVAVSLYLNPFWTLEDRAPATPDSLYSAVTRELSVRCKYIYESFAKVIGAQIVISAINTVLTAVFLVCNGYPYAALLLIFVFLCGLLPIVGNLVSNFMLVGVGFTISPRTGLFALVFLIAIHKLEYFLNSKIVGKRIKSPMWLTLIGLVVGERLMGVPGMILAPVLLHYIKVEASNYRAFPAAKPEEQP